MCGFIASHSGLRYLALLQNSESVLEHIPHDALPELSVFYGTPSGAAFILPGRPVHHLMLTGMQRDLSSENLSRIVLTSVPLRILDLSAMYVSPSILRHIATHLLTIEILKIKSTACMQDLLSLSSHLAPFKKLNWFDLASSRERKGAKMDVQRSLCCDWHSVCPSLRHIFLPFVDYDDMEPIMWEWYDDRGWLPSERPTEESADGLYRYTP
ncbi:hypothetical protein F5887DRAFT_1075850 [Amanita rubescens]|nr:hypothetical protein F5887DRAFT_1075850 [Amanita rubescens]